MTFVVKTLVFITRCDVIIVSSSYVLNRGTEELRTKIREDSFWSVQNFARYVFEKTYYVTAEESHFSHCLKWTTSLNMCNVSKN